MVGAVHAVQKADISVNVLNRRIVIHADGTYIECYACGIAVGLLDENNVTVTFFGFLVSLFNHLLCLSAAFRTYQ